MLAVSGESRKSATMQPELKMVAEAPFPICAASRDWCALLGVAEQDVLGCGFKVFDADFRPLLQVRDAGHLVLPLRQRAFTRTARCSRAPRACEVSASSVCETLTARANRAKCLNKGALTRSRPRSTRRSLRRSNSVAPCTRAQCSSLTPPARPGPSALQREKFLSASSLSFRTPPSAARGGRRRRSAQHPRWLVH